MTLRPAVLGGILGSILGGVLVVHAQKAGPVVSDPDRCPRGMTAVMESPGGCAPCAHGNTNCPCSRPTFRCFDGKVPKRLSDADERQLRDTLCRGLWDRELLDEQAKPNVQCGSPLRPTWMDLAELASRMSPTQSPQQLANELVAKYPAVACELASCWPQECAVAVSPDGQWLVTGGSIVRLWRLPERKLVAKIGDHARTAIALSFSNDSSLLATSTFDDNVRLWRIPSGELVRRIKVGDQNNMVAFVQGGRALFAGGNNGRAQIFSLTDGSPPLSFRERFALQTAAASPDGSVLYAASRLWDANSAQLVMRLDNGQGGYLCSAFSSDGKQLATGGGSYLQGQDYVVRVFEASTGKLVYSLAGHIRPVTAVAFSPDGRLLASGGSDGELRLWRLTDGTLVDRRPLGSISGLAFSPSGSEVFVTLQSGGITVHRLSNKP